MKGRNVVARLLVAVTTYAAVSPTAHSTNIATMGAVSNNQRITHAASTRGQIFLLLDRVDVKEQLEAHGVKPSDAKARVAALTDEEIAQLAASADSAPAGGQLLNPGQAVYAAMLVGGLILVGIFWIVAKAGQAVYHGVKYGPDKAPPSSSDASRY